MARDAYLIESKRVLVFWSRKAGNTSLAEWICKIVAPDGEGEGAARAYLSDHDYRINGKRALRLVKLEHFDDFILARNPYRRVLSAFLEKFVYYSQKPMDSIEELEPFAQIAFLRIMELKGKSTDPGAYLGSGNYPGISFKDFLEYINVAVAERARKGEPHLNPHWNTQVPLAYEGQFAYSNIIRLENLKAEIPRLAKRLDTTVPFPHMRPNSLKARVENDQDLSEATSVDLVRQGIVPGVDALLNRTTRALIKEAYRIDFSMLGYNPEEEMFERARAEPAPVEVVPRAGSKKDKRRRLFATMGVAAATAMLARNDPLAVARQEPEPSTDEGDVRRKKRTKADAGQARKVKIAALADPVAAVTPMETAKTPTRSKKKAEGSKVATQAKEATRRPKAAATAKRSHARKRTA
jgi:hypothetical protein